MGAKWRNKQASRSSTPAPNDHGLTGDTTDGDITYVDAQQGWYKYLPPPVSHYPGPVELEVAPWELAYKPTPAPIGMIRDMIDWEVGGQRGYVDNTPFSLGVVDSNTVEDFNWRGERAIIRRPRNPAEAGAVGTADSNALLAIIYAQGASRVYPNEVSQADLVLGV